MTPATMERAPAAARPYHAIAKFGLPLFIIAIAVVTGLREPHFWSIANAQNLARQFAPLQIVVIGQLFALLSGGLDLSVASVMACSGVVGILAVPYLGLCGALGIMILIGLLFGLANGALIVGFSVSPFIVTLGMLSVAKGLSLLFTGGLPLYTVPDSLVDAVGFGPVLGIPISSLIAFGAMLAWRLYPAQHDIRPSRLRCRIQRGRRAQFRRPCRPRLVSGLCHQRRGLGSRRHYNDCLGQRGAAIGW